MAICRHFHKPDLFLTMTANPKWPKIIHSLFSGQTATDRSDIVSQVFEQKKKALLKLIDNGFFGTTVAHIHTTFLPISLSCILPSFSKLSTTDWNSWMPPILSLWKQQNIMQSRI